MENKQRGPSGSSMGADRQTPNQIKNTVQKLPTAKDFRDTFYLNFKKNKNIFSSFNLLPFTSNCNFGTYNFGKLLILIHSVQLRHPKLENKCSQGVHIALSEN